MGYDQKAVDTFLFASTLQKFADDRGIKIVSFSSKERCNRKGCYDFLSVDFLIPRPDRNEKYLLEKTIQDLENEIQEGEVDNNEI